MTLVEQLKDKGYVTVIPKAARVLHKKMFIRELNKTMAHAKKSLPAFKKDPYAFISNIRDDFDLFKTAAVILNSSARRLSAILVHYKQDPLVNALAMFYAAPFIDVFKLKPAMRMKIIKTTKFPGSKMFYYVNEIADSPYTPDEYLSAYPYIDENTYNLIKYGIFVTFVSGDYNGATVDRIEFTNWAYSNFDREHTRALPLENHPDVEDFIRSFKCSDAKKLVNLALATFAKVIAKHFTEIDYVVEKIFEDIKDNGLVVKKPSGNLYDCLRTKVLDEVSEVYASEENLGIAELIYFTTPEALLELKVNGSQAASKIVEQLNDKDFVYELFNEELDIEDILPAFVFIDKVAPSSIDIDIIRLVVGHLAEDDANYIWSKRDIDYTVIYKKLKQLPIPDAVKSSDLIDYIKAMCEIVDFQDRSPESVYSVMTEIVEDAATEDWVAKALGDLRFLDDIVEYLDDDYSQEAAAEILEVMRSVELKGEEKYITELTTGAGIRSTPISFGIKSYDILADYIKQWYMQEKPTARELLENHGRFGIKEIKTLYSTDAIDKTASATQPVLDKIYSNPQRASVFSYFIEHSEPLSSTASEEHRFESLYDMLIEAGFPNSALTFNMIELGSKFKVLDMEHPRTMVNKALVLTHALDLIERVTGRPCTRTSLRASLGKIDRDTSNSAIVHVNIDTSNMLTYGDILYAAAPALHRIYRIGESKDDCIKQLVPENWLTTFPQVKVGAKVNKDLIQLLSGLLYTYAESKSDDSMFEEKSYNQMSETERWAADALGHDITLADLNKLMQILKSSYPSMAKKRLSLYETFDKDFYVVVSTNPVDIANMSASPFLKSCQRLLDEEGQLACVGDGSAVSALNAASDPHGTDLVIFATYNDIAVARVTASISGEGGKLSIYFGESGNVYGSVTDDSRYDEEALPSDDFDGNVEDGLNKTVSVGRGILSCLIQLLDDEGLVARKIPYHSNLYA